MIAIAVVAVLSVMPAEYYERMNTIKTYEQDQSAMGRINAWWFAFNLALARPLVGGGFETFQPSLFALYAPNPQDYHDVHSIYFEVLGEHGFVGLFLFLSLMWMTWRMAGRVRRAAGLDAGRKWLVDLMAMIQVSLVGYAVGGAFLGLAYFDLYYHLVALVVIANRLQAGSVAVSLVPASGSRATVAPHSAQETRTGDPPAAGGASRITIAGGKP